MGMVASNTTCNVVPLSVGDLLHSIDYLRLLWDGSMPPSPGPLARPCARSPAAVWPPGEWRWSHQCGLRACLSQLLCLPDVRGALALSTAPSQFRHESSQTPQTGASGRRARAKRRRPERGVYLDPKRDGKFVQRQPPTTPANLFQGWRPFLRQRSWHRRTRSGGTAPAAETPATCPRWPWERGSTTTRTTTLPSTRSATARPRPGAARACVSIEITPKI